MKHVVYAADIALGVRQATAGYHDVVELEDAMQEGLLAFYAIQWPEECDDPERMVTSKVRSAVREFCERERGARFGYEAFDQFAYSPKWVRALLPEALAYELTGDLPQSPAELRVSGGSGKPSDGRNLQVVLLDILGALAECSDRDRALLWAKHVDELSDADAGELLGIAEGSVSALESRAVDRVCRRLNDARRRADSEHEGPGSRRSLSSGHAQAITANTFEVSAGQHLRPRRALRRVAAHDQPELQ